MANILLKNIRFKTLMLRSDLCNYSYAYFVVKERITIERDNYDKTRNKKLIFKSNTSLDHAYQKSTTHLQTMQKIKYRYANV